jgi:DNA-directed RNA polymerase subunit N (RpoN/RPB10)
MSSFPIACFTCRKRIAHLYEGYRQAVDGGQNELEVLDKMGLGRMCCRRMFITHQDIDKYMLLFPVYPDRIQRLSEKVKNKRDDDSSDSSDTDGSSSDEGDDDEGEDEDEEEDDDNEEDDSSSE